jgi:hypothetical protein
MFREPFVDAKIGACLCLVVLVVLFCVPRAAFGWGNNAQRLIINHAVDSLPPDTRSFFETNRHYFIQHVNDTLDLVDKNPGERNNHFIELDKYGKFPFESLPRSYQAAITKYSKSKIYATGVLPWQIGVYSQKLTEDLKAGRWDDAKRDAAAAAPGRSNAIHAPPARPAQRIAPAGAQHPAADRAEGRKNKVKGGGDPRPPARPRNLGRR